MSNSYTITVSKSTLTIEPSKSGSSSFTVTNKTGKAMTVRAEAVFAGQGEPSWLAIDRAEVREFSADGTQQYLVKISVPANAVNGTYPFKLRVYSVDDPDEYFAESSVVEVTVPKVEAPQPEKKLNFIAIAAVVASIILAIVAIYFGIQTKHLERQLQQEKELTKTQTEEINALREQLPKELETSFKLIGQSFETLSNENIPEDTLEELKSLENKEFMDKEKFIEAVKERIGEEQTDDYEELILKHARKTIHNYGKEDDIEHAVWAQMPLTGKRNFVEDVQQGEEFPMVLRNMASEKCLDVASGNSDDGTNVLSWQCHSGAVQRWRRMDAKSEEEGWFLLKNKASEKCLHFDKDSTNIINSWRCNNKNEDQHWKVEDAGDGWVYFINRTAGEYLEVKDGGTVNGTNVQVDEYNGSPVQKWWLE